MGLLALTEPDLRLVVRSGALHVERRGAVVQAVRVHELDLVQLYGAADLSAGARNLLLREGIDVVFLTASGRLRGRLVSSEGRQGALRLAQYRLVADPTRRLALARSIVAGKIANQRALWVARKRRLRSEAIADALALTRELAARVDDAPDLEVLRGLEGLVARHYFGTFGQMISHPDLTFQGRTRRPPRDPVNACLSFAYTLLLSRVESAVRAVGLDPYLGALHKANRGAPALALDLVEELRPVADNVVLTLVNRRQLGPDDFRCPTEEEVGEHAEGAVYLDKVGRTILVRALERRLREPATHPVTGQRWPLVRLLQEQARQVARLCLGEADAYLPLAFGGPHG